MTFGYFGGPDCETCGGYYPGNPNAMPSHFCNCKPMWQRFEELYAGRVKCYLTTVKNGKVVEGWYVSDTDHPYYEHAKKLADYPVVEFVNKHGRTITLSREPLSVYEEMCSDDE